MARRRVALIKAAAIGLFVKSSESKQQEITEYVAVRASGKDSVLVNMQGAH